MMTEGNKKQKATSDIILYQTEDGKSRIQVQLEDGTVWLTQAQMAELFQTTPQNITLHLRSIFAERELLEEATCKDYLQVRREGSRDVRRALKHYNLDAVLAVGYRVRSHRGTQFRQWATERLLEFLVKGFTMDDERLKEGPTLGTDYFDELLNCWNASATSVPRRNVSIKRSAISTNWRWIPPRRAKRQRSSSASFRTSCTGPSPPRQPPN